MIDYVSESEALAVRFDGFDVYAGNDIDDDDTYKRKSWTSALERSVVRDEQKSESSIQKYEAMYRENKEAKAGSVIRCAGYKCGKEFAKKSYQQVFCCTKCKDSFWNYREFHFGFRKKAV